MTKLLIKEYHDVADPKDVTFGILPTNQYEIDRGMIFNDHEIHKLMHSFISQIEFFGWDWIMFHDQDHMIFYHGQVITGDDDGG